MKVLTINRSQCNGCGACQMVCSLTKKTDCAPLSPAFEFGELAARTRSTCAYANIAPNRYVCLPVCVGLSTKTQLQVL